MSEQVCEVERGGLRGGLRIATKKLRHAAISVLWCRAKKISHDGCCGLRGSLGSKDRRRRAAFRGSQLLRNHVELELRVCRGYPPLSGEGFKRAAAGASPLEQPESTA